MARLGLLLAVVTLAACGPAEVPVLAANVRVQGLSAADVDSLSLYVFGPWRSNPEVMLTCDALMFQEVAPTDPSLDRLANQSFGAGGQQLAVDNVAAGEGRIVYVEAHKVGRLAGNGCAEDIEVKEGASTTVDLTVWPPKSAP